MLDFIPFDFDFSPILPLGIILFDLLFLIVAIPIEAYILKARLKFDPRSSVFYAISINLFSNVAGWLVFFFIEPSLSTANKSEVLNYVFFNRFQSEGIYSLLFLIAFFIFFATFFFKTLSLQSLLFLWNKSEKKKPEQEVPLSQRRSSRRYNLNKIQQTNVVTSVLIANSLSYTAITIIIAICFSWQLIN
ncbi:MAG: filament integrity protein fraC [Calothrix sp. MO_192.B10]|nr:filament integrity protein fraC [Calothrix sp. MO_192.B10]